MKTFRALVILAAWASAASCLAQGPGKGKLEELDAAFLKGQALEKMGKLVEAIPFFEQAAALAPEVFGPEHLNTAAILNRLGMACLQGGQPKKALSAFTASLQIREKTLGKTHEKVGDCLSNIGDTHRQLGQFKEAEPFYLRSLEISEAKLGKEHPDVLVTLNNLAVLYSDMGRLEEAESLLLRVLRTREARFGRDHADVGRVLNSLASVYVALGRFGDAEAAARRSVTILEDKLGKNHFSLEDPLNSLGLACHELGRYADAEDHLTRSLRLREARLPKDHPDLASVINNLALVYLDTQRFAQGERFFLRAVAILEAHFGKEHHHLGDALNNLGTLYHGLGRHKDAEAAFQRSLKICEAAYGKDHHQVAPTLNNLAALYLAQERYEDAEPLLLRAMKISEAKLGKHHPQVAAQAGNLASIYVGLKRPAEAEALYVRSLKTAESIHGPDHPELSAPLYNFARFYTQTGRLEEAERMLVRGLAIVEKSQSDHLAAGLISQGLAEVNFLMGRPKEALVLHDKGMRIVQAMIDNVFVFSNEQAMHAYLQQVGDSLPSLLRMAAASPADDTAGLALDWTLRRKGIVLDTVRRFRQVQDLLSGDDPLGRRVDDYRSLKQKLADAALKPPAGKDAESVKKEMEAWHKELQSMEAELNRGLAERLPATTSGAIDAEAVRKRLAPGTVLIDFVRCPLRGKEGGLTRSRYLAFVLHGPPGEPGGVSPRSKAPPLIDLGEAPAIDKAVAALRQEFVDFQEKLKECESDEEIKALEKAEEKKFHKTSQALHALVFAPLEKTLGSAKLVYLAPDGDLSRLPFEALVDKDGKYLVERFQFAYLSSGRDLLRPEAAPAKGTVVFANPDFRLDPGERKDLATKLLGGKKPGKDSLIAPRGASDTRSVGWKALPGAAAEAKDIEKLMHDSAYGPVRSFQGPEALEEVLKAMPPPRVLHLATHGFFVDHDPDAAWKEGAGAGWARGRLKQMDNPLLRSGIVLAGANTVGGTEKSARVEDGWVTAEEIALVNLRGTELVVLSACQTGLGDLKTGEGVSGLRWAFLYAGARTLVTSLFEVPDTETRDLMKHFYGRLKSHGKLEALRGAQLALIQQRRDSHRAAHPFFWASFVLVGDPR